MTFVDDVAHQIELEARMVDAASVAVWSACDRPMPAGRRPASHEPRPQPVRWTSQ